MESCAKNDILIHLLSVCTLHMFTEGRFCACWPGVLSLIVSDDPPETDILLKIKKEPADTYTTGKRYFNQHSWLGWVKALDFWFQGCWCSLSCCPASILRLRSCYLCLSYVVADMCRGPKTGSKIHRIPRQNSLTGSKSPGIPWYNTDVKSKINDPTTNNLGYPSSTRSSYKHRRQDLDPQDP